MQDLLRVQNQILINGDSSVLLDEEVNCHVKLNGVLKQQMDYVKRIGSIGFGMVIEIPGSFILRIKLIMLLSLLQN